jgi:phosphatidylglycerophosphatase A
MKIWTTINKTFATAFGLGLSPVAPGTMGALGGIATGLWILNTCPFPNYILILLIVLCTVLGAVSSKILELEWGDDPSRIVIDEVVGMWISMLFLPALWECYLAAFILFRLFDIFKPLYIKRMEYIKNGWGVMMDDVLAGIYANIILQISILVLKKYLLM